MTLEELVSLLKYTDNLPIDVVVDGGSQHLTQNDLSRIRNKSVVKLIIVIDAS